MNFEFSGEILKFRNIKFHENSSSVIRDIQKSVKERMTTIRVAFPIFDIALIRTEKHKHTHIITTQRCHCQICLLEVNWNCVNNT